LPFPIHDRQVRARLEVRTKPYYVRIASGLHLGYRRGKVVSRWVVRTLRDGRYETRTMVDVEPDDCLPADGGRIVSFRQMVARIMKETKGTLSCSFCNRPHTEVARIVAGPGVFICDACVALCQIYFDHPHETGKLLVEDGRPVHRDGKPVFVPLSEAEAADLRALRGD
jgi:hypothetical protein